MRRELLHTINMGGKTLRTERPGFVAKAQSLCTGAELVLGTCRNYFFPKHAHAEYTIGAVLSGTESIFCRGVQEQAGCGSLYFTRPDEIHSGQSLGNSAWKFASLYLSPAFFLACFEGEQPEFKIAVQENARSSAFFVNFIKLLSRPNCDVERQSALITAIRNLTKSNMADRSVETRVKAHQPAITRSIAFMHANFASPIKLIDIAGIAGLHPGYFIDSFAKDKGITPHAYLLSIRLNAAKQALAAGQNPADAAVSSGFYDQSHLNRHFAKVFGMTSGQFQKQVLPIN